MPWLSPVHVTGPGSNSRHEPPRRCHPHLVARRPHALARDRAATTAKWEALRRGGRPDLLPAASGSALTKLSSKRVHGQSMTYTTSTGTQS